jgi:hypothetical protein
MNTSWIPAIFEDIGLAGARLCVTAVLLKGQE